MSNAHVPSAVFHVVKPFYSWYHSNFGSSHSQSIMLCVQATMMMLLPELWIFMLWPPLLPCLIYHSADIASTAVNNYCTNLLWLYICCIHLLWIYCCHRCGQPQNHHCDILYTTQDIMLHPLTVDMLLPLLWYFVHCCGSVLDIYCCGSVQSTLPATDSSVI